MYVGTDGKLHYVDKAGADSALNFSSGLKTTTVTVSATDFPDLFTYIDVRDATYTIADSSKRIVSFYYDIVIGNGTCHASSITISDALTGGALVYATNYGDATKNFCANGLKIKMYSTAKDGDLHFTKITYTYLS